MYLFIFNYPTCKAKSEVKKLVHFVGVNLWKSISEFGFVSHSSCLHLALPCIFHHFCLVVLEDYFHTFSLASIRGELLVLCRNSSFRFICISDLCWLCSADCCVCDAFYFYFCRSVHLLKGLAGGKGKSFWGRSLDVFSVIFHGYVYLFVFARMMII